MPRKKQQEEGVLSLRGLQKFMHIGYINAKELLETGQIPAQKLGTRWKVHTSAVIDWMSKTREAAQ